MAKQIQLHRGVLALPGSRLQMTENAPICGADAIVPDRRARV
jgi:hypothetical protein